MKTALYDLLTSKKFLAAISAGVIYVTGRWGFAVDPTTLDRIFAALLVYVGAQGIADHGKSAAEINALAQARLFTPPSEIAKGTPVNLPAGSTSIAGALVALLLVGAIGGVTACATVKAAPGTAGHAVVDCAKAEARPILQLAGQLAAQALLAAIDQGSIDWPALEESAATEGRAIGGCALTRFVADLSRAPRSDTSERSLIAPPDPVADGRAAIARLSRRFDGTTWTAVAMVSP